MKRMKMLGLSLVIATLILPVAIFATACGGKAIVDEIKDEINNTALLVPNGIYKLDYLIIFNTENPENYEEPVIDGKWVDPEEGESEEALMWMAVQLNNLIFTTIVTSEGFDVSKSWFYYQYDGKIYTYRPMPVNGFDGDEEEEEETFLFSYEDGVITMTVKADVETGIYKFNYVG